MRKFPVIAVSVAVIAGMTSSGEADESAKPAELKTYAVSCKVIRKALLDTPEGKRKLETLASTIPDLIMLEGTWAEYQQGGRRGSAPFELRVKVTAAAKGKVRLEVRVWDSWAEAGQRAVRQARLSTPTKLELDSKEQGAGVWVELTVRESPEE
jgi:hypothetical protein